jgi:hypothetical protein
VTQSGRLVRPKIKVRRQKDSAFTLAIPMTRRQLLWSIPLVLYLAFAYWYTNTDGPLRPEEIQSYNQIATDAGIPADSMETIHLFMSSDTGRQFFMVNSIDLSEDPPKVDGADVGESAAQLLGRYMEYMYPEMLRRASHPVFLASAVNPSIDLVGIEGAEEWSLVAVMRYRSRRDLVEIVTNPEFLGRHHFKVAALTKTIAFPTESRIYLSDPRFLLALVLVALAALLDIVIFGRRHRK